jgi:hypothetical protein
MAVGDLSNDEAGANNVVGSLNREMRMTNVQTALSSGIPPSLGNFRGECTDCTEVYTRQKTVALELLFILLGR